jgi:hypothetical protein
MQRKPWIGVALAVVLLLAAAPVKAEDIEGRIEALDPANQTLVVQGITFFATPTTDYDDGLRSFADLELGQKVEVDFVYRDGRHIATEIELDE